MRRFGGGSPPTSGPGEDWSVPLVPGRGGGNLETLPSAPATGRSMSTPAQAPVAGPRLRCLIATGVLDVGGAEEFAASLSRELPRYGLDTTVVYADTRLPGQVGAGGRLVQTLLDAGVPTVPVTADNVRDWMRQQRPDVISAHYAPDFFLDAATELDIPWVETLHGMHMFFHPDSWGPERQRARNIAAQIAVSDLVRRQYLVRNPEYRPDRIVTVPNGLDQRRAGVVDRARARAALGLTDEFLFVSLARYCLQKNTYGLVSAFAEVAAVRPDVHLLVAGRAADDLLYFEQTRQLARGLPCADRIHLRGHCANPTALLAAADGFVQDSFFEGWSLASMEALMAGLPVILSDVGGAREQLGADLRRGYLVGNPGADPELVDWRVITDIRFLTQPNRAQLVAAMTSMVDGRAYWGARRSQLRAEALGLFPYHVCVGRHADVLISVATGGAVPSFMSDTVEAEHA